MFGSAASVIMTLKDIALDCGFAGICVDDYYDDYEGGRKLCI